MRGERTVNVITTKRTRSGRRFQAGRFSGGSFKTRKGEGLWIWRAKKK
jgi:hypothetical protein